MIKDALLVEFDHELSTTRRLLERIPDDKLTWKPHDKSRSLGELALHVANLPNWGPFILERLEFDLRDNPFPISQQPASNADLLAIFETARGNARKAMDKTDAELAALWVLKRNNQELFALPRLAAFRSFVLNHMIHHRGQLSVYLRLNDIAVPAIYGPTADEG